MFEGIFEATDPCVKQFLRSQHYRTCIQSANMRVTGAVYQRSTPACHGLLLGADPLYLCVLALLHMLQCLNICLYSTSVFAAAAPRAADHQTRQ